MRDEPCRAPIGRPCCSKNRRLQSSSRDDRGRRAHFSVFASPSHAPPPGRPRKAPRPGPAGLTDPLKPLLRNEPNLPQVVATSWSEIDFWGTPSPRDLLPWRSSKRTQLAPNATRKNEPNHDPNSGRPVRGRDVAIPSVTIFVLGRRYTKFLRKIARWRKNPSPIPSRLPFALAEITEPPGPSGGPGRARGG